jgi:hypothetical protein
MTSGLAQTEVLEPDLLAPRHARHYARLACEGVTSQCQADEVALVVSELVTNAMRHARSQINLVLRVSPGEVFVAVQDHRPSLVAAPPNVDPVGEHGRGLVIVAEIASAWGVHSLGDSGKLVWCVIHAPVRQSNAGWASPGIPFLLGASDRMGEPFATEVARFVS